MITLLQATSEMAVEMTQITESMSFGDLFMAGGWLMWPLLALLGVAIFIFVEGIESVGKTFVCCCCCTYRRINSREWVTVRCTR